MSGIEPIIAAEAAGATAAASTAAATTAAAATAAELAAATAAAEAATYASTVPGLVAAGPGSQAALLAAQTAEFGLPGLTATAAAGAMPGTLSAAAWDLANKAMLPGSSTGMRALSQGAQLLGPSGQGQRTAYSPPQLNRGRQVTLAEPIQGLLQPQPTRRKREMLSLL